MADNFAQAFFSGQDDRRNQQIRQQEQQRRNQLADLSISKEERAQQVDQRQALYSLAKGYKSYVAQNPEGGQQYYDRFLAPSLRGLGYGDIGPYDPAAVGQVADQVLAAFETVQAGKNGQVQSTRIGADGYYYTVNRQGQWTNSGIQANPNIQILEQEGQLPVGIVKSGGVAGSTVPIGGMSQSGGMAPPRLGAVDDGEPVARRLMAYSQRLQSLGLTPEQQQALMTAYEQEQNVVPVPDVGGPPVASQPSQIVRTPTSGEKAYATEAAKTEAQLNYGPQVAAQEADAARIKKEAEAKAERNANAAKRAAQAQESIDTLNEAITLLPGATSGRLESLGAAGMGALGLSTRGAQATAQLRLLAAKLIANVPRFEGPQSNIDVQFYREAAGDLANENLPSETRQAAARKMLEISQKYVGQQGAPRSIERRARNPQTGEILVLRNGQWVSE